MTPYSCSNGFCPYSTGSGEHPMTWYPRFSNSMAKLYPIPDEAPVINAYFGMIAEGVFFRFDVVLGIYERLAVAAIAIAIAIWFSIYIYMEIVSL